MKKIFFILTVFISALFLSCKSAPSETFVNTGIDTQGNIFTVCVFSKITNVTVKEFESDKPQQNILPEDIQYNQKTTELKINIPEGFSENKENLVFHVEGVAVFPAEFVLNLYNSEKGKPIVIFEDKVCVEGTDYTFDAQTNTVKFISEADADKSAYYIVWPTKDGTSSIGNKTEKYAEQYEQFILEWLKTLKF